MTELEWLGSADAEAMLRALTLCRCGHSCDAHGNTGGCGACRAHDCACDRLRPVAELSERKIRLFCCACCRVAWRLLDARARKAVVGAECYADGQIGTEELADLCADAHLSCKFSSSRAGHTKVGAASHMAHCAADDHGWLPEVLKGAALVMTGEHLAGLLRDVVGNPFRGIAWSGMHGARITLGPPATGPDLHAMQPRWLTPTVREGAEAIYAARAFDELPILADALEEAGCDDPNLLRHARGRGPHVRGCWLLDLLTAKC